MIYYNFIRPYIGLDDGTPAEGSGNRLEPGNNKWLAYLRKA